MSEYPIITIRNDEDVSLLSFHLNRGDKVGFTIPIDVPRKECYRLMDVINDFSKAIIQ
jgi:hypothetical protein